MRAVAARWWATAHRARSEEQEQERLGCPQIAKSNKKNAHRSGRLSEVRCLPCLGARPRPQPRTGPATCRANWLVGGGAASPSERRKQCMQPLRPDRARGASRCMRGAENLVLQEGQAARRDLTRALKAGPPGGAERSHRLFVLPAPPSELGARCTRHTVSPETLPCPSIVKCDLVCKCHLRTAVHL